jgi:hypothetical protein
VLFKLYNVYTMISDSGWAINQWGLYRYLSEAVYFPTALLPSPHVRWEPVDKNSARCVLTHGSSTVSAIFHVTKSGAIDTMFTPKRVRYGSMLDSSKIHFVSSASECSSCADSIFFFWGMFLCAPSPPKRESERE